MSGKEKRRRRNWLFSLRRYLTFFVLMAFIITCCMLLFLNTMTRATGLELSQAYVEAAAKVTFLNILLLALVCTLIDGLRRKWMVGRPVRKIIKAAEQITQGDFSARVPDLHSLDAGDGFGEIADCFNKMAQELSGTETLRTDFIANVSHELKTPIALIQGYAEGLTEGMAEDKESRDYYCNVIMDEAGKMNKMVKQLLTLTALEFGKDQTVMERFNLTELISGVISASGILLEQNGITAEFDNSAPVYVWADEFKIEEVVTNYFSNAIHHAGGEKKIIVKMLPEGEKVRVSVFNTGTPIPEEALPNLWTKFYKVDKARTREYGGSGIGLSIVKAIMESHHQSYGVKNWDNGVEFWFTVDGR